MISRYFRTPLPLTFPISIKPGPGGEHVRSKPGELHELDGDRCNAEARFIAGRLRAGDLVEMTAAEYAAAINPAPSAKPVKE
jgi:hypothetical protein